MKHEVGTTDQRERRRAPEPLVAPPRVRAVSAHRRWAVCVAGGRGTLGYHWLEAWPWLDTLYMTVAAQDEHAVLFADSPELQFDLYPGLLNGLPERERASRGFLDVACALASETKQSDRSSGTE